MLGTLTSMMKKRSEGKAKMPTAIMGFGLLAIFPPEDAAILDAADNFYDI